MGYGTRTKGCKHSDHLKSTTGRSPTVRKASNLVSRPELILYLIKIWEAISESEPEVDAVVVSAPVEGYKSSDFLVLGLPSPPLLLFRPSRRHRFAPGTLRCLLKSNCSPKTRSRRVRCSPHTRGTPLRCLMCFVHTVAYIPLLSKLPEDTGRLETTVIRFSGRNQLDAVPKDDRRLCGMKCGPDSAQARRME